MAIPNKNRKKPRPRRKRDDRKETPCIEVRLGIVVGAASDTALDGAAQWLLARAGALGGNFRLWHSRRAGRPLENFRDVDVSGGHLHAGATEHYEHPGSGQSGYGDVLADCRDCRGRVVELVLFHHGSAVDESALGDRLVKIFEAIRVPVCRVVWWACNASVSLDVQEAHWTDLMMRRLGRFARCHPCGCAGPIELIWPTQGRCHLSGTGPNDTLQTNDGKVNRARWGYPQPDGSLGTAPVGTGTLPAQPTHRDPPYNQPIQPQGGSVLGTNVTKRP